MAVSHDISASLNVVHAPGLESQPFSKWKELSVSQAKANGATAVTAATLRLAGYPAVRLAYVSTKTGQPNWIAQYVIDRSGSTYIISFGTTRSLQPRYSPVFGRIAASFRFTS